MVLVEAFKARCGADWLMTGWQCTGFEQDDGEVILHFVDPRDGSARPPVKAAMVVSAEGIHSKIRRQLYPNEGPPRYSGINMWRGVTRWKPFLTGASMVRIGWLNKESLAASPAGPDPAIGCISFGRSECRYMKAAIRSRSKLRACPATCDRKD